MWGKIAIVGIVLTALIAGAAMWWLQVYAYYEEVPANGSTDVALTTLSGTAEPILYENFRAIDAESSPIRYRACFTTPQSQAMLTETYEVFETPEPLVAPGWFECFDAEALGRDLETGSAIAFVGTRNVVVGVDRIVAIYGDGRGFVWHQLNECGEKSYDGTPLGDDCTAAPPLD